MSRRRAFEVVDAFEAALSEFTGAPHVVTVDSCTNAIFLSLLCYGGGLFEYGTAQLPKHTYVGVAQAVRNAGLDIEWTDAKWEGAYRIGNTPVVDAAKRFHRGMYDAGTLTCVSFQAGKLLPIGRGGAILTDDAGAAKWLRNARLDGRTAGADYQDNTYQEVGYHCYLDPPSAARGLWLMTYLEDDDKGDWTEYPDLSEAGWV